MKYFLNGTNGTNNEGLIRLPLSLSLIIILLFWIVNFILFYVKLGFTPESVTSYYLGNENLFQPARSYVSMLEISHGHLAMFSLLLLVVTHLVIFTDHSKKIKYLIIGGTYLSALTSEISSWMIRFYSPVFSWLKLAGFFALQLFILICLLGLVQYIRKLRNGSGKIK